MTDEVCTWVEAEGDEFGSWSTSCGQSHYFGEGTPEQNEYKFCPFCGKLIMRMEIGYLKGVNIIPEPDEDDEV